MNPKPYISRAKTMNQIKFNQKIDTKNDFSISTSIGNTSVQNSLTRSLPFNFNMDERSIDKIIEIPMTQSQQQLPLNADNQKLPIMIFCSKCQKPVLTKTEKQYGCGALLVTFLILLLFWPLFWVPCIVSECRDISHYCPSCDEKVGEKLYKLCQ